MKWVDNIMEKVKGGIRSWLNVQPANPSRINITETLDYEANAIKNRIWYRGDSNAGRVSGRRSAVQGWRSIRFIQDFHR